MAAQRGSPRAASYFHISDNLYIKFDNNDKKGNFREPVAKFDIIPNAQPLICKIFVLTFPLYDILLNVLNNVRHRKKAMCNGADGRAVQHLHSTATQHSTLIALYRSTISSHSHILSQRWTTLSLQCCALMKGWPSWPKRRKNGSVERAEIP